jgi:hypothetical protein
MLVDHITYQVPAGTLKQDSLPTMLDDLGLREIAVQEDTPQPERCTLRWWEDDEGFQLHIIEHEDKMGPIPLMLGHFCVHVTKEALDRARDSEFCTRDRPESPRLWLEHPAGIRIEVREQSEVGQKTVVRDPTRIQDEIFTKALRIYERRNEGYRDNWVRFGWKGCIFRVKERAERLWDGLWDRSDALTPEQAEALKDDCIDLINFAAFTYRAIDERNRNGDWFDD